MPLTVQWCLAVLRDVLCTYSKYRYVTQGSGDKLDRKIAHHHQEAVEERVPVGLYPGARVVLWLVPKFAKPSNERNRYQADWEDPRECHHTGDVSTGVDAAYRCSRLSDANPPVDCYEGKVSDTDTATG